MTARLRPRRSPTSKLSEADIREILTAPDSKTLAQWAAAKRCHTCTIYDVIYGVSWVHVAPELPRKKTRAKPHTSEDEIERIRKLARKHSLPEVARMVGKMRTTVWRVAKRRTHGEIY